MDENERVLRHVVDGYVYSHDYNGVPGALLAAQTGIEWEALKPSLAGLIQDGLVEIVHTDWFPNPHIRPFDPPPVDEQLSKLIGARDISVCLYPTPRALEAKRVPRRYTGRPYARRLWRGEPQFRPVFFDMVVLERYQRDPRFQFQFHDNGGLIGVRDDYFTSPGFPDRDRVLVQTFGIGYDGSGGRVVAVFLRYLADLTPEHQRIWEAHERRDPCRISADYLRSAMGEFSTHGSIFTALLLEQSIVNQMCDEIGRPRLFRHTYEAERPDRIHVLFQPTLANFNAFVNELDKLLSQNLDPAFFRGEVAPTRTVTRRDGLRTEEPRGSLDQLEEWLRTRFRTDDVTAVDRVIAPMRQVRRDRQTPAHSITQDRYDPALWNTQDELVEHAYTSMRTLRLILANFPGAGGVPVPDWLFEGRIRQD